MVHTPSALLVTVESFANPTDAPEIGAPVTASSVAPVSVHVFGGGGGVTTGGGVGLDGVEPQAEARTRTTRIRCFPISSNHRSEDIL